MKIIDVRGKTRDEANAALRQATAESTTHVHVRNDSGTYCPYDDPECAIGAQKTLTRDNTDEIANWCGGLRAGGANELVHLPGQDHQYANPGDTIRRTADDRYEIVAKTERCGEIPGVGPACDWDPNCTEHFPKPQAGDEEPTCRANQYVNIPDTHNGQALCGCPDCIEFVADRDSEEGL